MVGITSGSILGPILFNNHVNGLFFCFSCYVCNVADDTAPYVCNISFISYVRKVRRAGNPHHERVNLDVLQWNLKCQNQTVT